MQTRKSTISIVTWTLLTCLPLGGLLQLERVEAAETAMKTSPDKIAALLRQAQQAIVAGRLSVPPTDSAVSYIQQVLDIEPNHPGAQQLLRKVVTQYGIMSDARIKRGQSALQRELQTAAELHRRGVTLSERYGINDRGLESVGPRLQTAAVTQSAPTNETTDTTLAGLKLAEDYLARSEQAMQTDATNRARRYALVAEELLKDVPQPSSTAERLQRIKDRLAANSETARGFSGTMLPTGNFRPGLMIFVPPSL